MADKIQRAAIVVIVCVLCFGAGAICPERLPAHYCGVVQSLNSSVSCTTVLLVQSDDQLVLCQVLSSGGDVPRGYTTYTTCRFKKEQKVWECNHETPRGIFQAILTEMEWNNESVRCKKLCGECPSGWIGHSIYWNQVFIFK
jgi:hypothetical protein